VVDYSHSSLGKAVPMISQKLSAHGLSHQWSSEQEELSTVRVTCTLTHELGHSISVSMIAPVDASGGKNAVQAIGSTTTYLQRYTFFAVTGLAADDGSDTDGDTPETASNPVSEDQAHELRALVEDVGINPSILFERARCTGYEDFPATKYNSAITWLEGERSK